MSGQDVLIHATAVARAGCCVLLCGPPGAGKSDLALRLIAQSPATSARDAPFVLVADDQVVLTLANGQLLAAPPTTIAGKLEVRGIGIVTVPFIAEAKVALHVDLVATDAIERMPPPAFVTHAGLAIPAVRLRPFEASATAKVGLALARVARCDTWP